MLPHLSPIRKGSVESGTVGSGKEWMELSFFQSCTLEGGVEGYESRVVCRTKRGWNETVGRAGGSWWRKGCPSSARSERSEAERRIRRADERVTLSQIESVQAPPLPPYTWKIFHFESMLFPFERECSPCSVVWKVTMLANFNFFIKTRRVFFPDFFEGYPLERVAFSTG